MDLFERHNKLNLGALLTELSLELLTFSDFIDIFPLESIHVWVQISELYHTHFTQVRHALVGYLGLEVDLAEGHILAAKQRIH